MDKLKDEWNHILEYSSWYDILYSIRLAIKIDPKIIQRTLNLHYKSILEKIPWFCSCQVDEGQHYDILGIPYLSHYINDGRWGESGPKIEFHHDPAHYHKDGEILGYKRCCIDSTKFRSLDSMIEIRIQDNIEETFKQFLDVIRKHIVVGNVPKRNWVDRKNFSKENYHHAIYFFIPPNTNYYTYSFKYFLEFIKRIDPSSGLEQCVHSYVKIYDKATKELNHR